MEKSVPARRVQRVSPQPKEMEKSVPVKKATPQEKKNLRDKENVPPDSKKKEKSVNEIQQEKVAVNPDTCVALRTRSKKPASFHPAAVAALARPAAGKKKAASSKPQPPVEKSAGRVNKKPSIHHSLYPFRCLKCPMSFQKEQSLMDHQQNTKKCWNHAYCYVCPESYFTTQKTYENHMLTKHDQDHEDVEYFIVHREIREEDE